MSYTIDPKIPNAKAYSANARVSPKNAKKVCRLIRGKKYKQVNRLLNDLIDKKRSIEGKYYTNSVKEIKNLLESCMKNAEYKGLNTEKLFVHASATHGSVRRRRRRKASFGSRMKMANIEMILLEKGV